MPSFKPVSLKANPVSIPLHTNKGWILFYLKVGTFQNIELRKHEDLVPLTLSFTNFSIPFVLLKFARSEQESMEGFSERPSLVIA